jgi:hypothetical protein
MRVMWNDVGGADVGCDVENQDEVCMTLSMTRQRRTTRGVIVE